MLLLKQHHPNSSIAMRSSGWNDLIVRFVCVFDASMQIVDNDFCSSLFEAVHSSIELLLEVGIIEVVVPWTIEMAGKRREMNY